MRFAVKRSSCLPSRTGTAGRNIGRKSRVGVGDADFQTIKDQNRDEGTVVSVIRLTTRG